MAENDQGYIRVTVRTADGAIPIERAIVTIKSTNEELIAVFFTDEDGNTPILKVAAPPIQNSEAPNTNAPAYYLYNIDTDKSGYKSVRNIGVPVYPSVTSVQPVELIPLSENSGMYSGDTIFFRESEVPKL